jgi:hypothetical protein
LLIVFFVICGQQLPITITERKKRQALIVLNIGVCEIIFPGKANGNRCVTRSL